MKNSLKLGLLTAWILSGSSLIVNCQAKPPPALSGKGQHAKNQKDGQSQESQESGDPDASNANFLARSWDQPQLLETDDVSRAWKVYLAASPDNKIGAVWAQHDGTVHNVWARIFAANQWGAPVRIGIGGSGDNLATPIVPVMAWTKNQAIAVWVSIGGSSTQVYSATYNTATSQWTAATKISAHSVGAPQYLNLSCQPDLGCIAAWALQSLSDSGSHVEAVWFRNGTWGSVQALSSISTNWINYLSLDTNASGDAAAVWNQDSGDGNANTVNIPRLWFNRFKGVTQKWDGSKLIDGAPADHSSDLGALTMTDEGRIAVVWLQDGINKNQAQIMATIETSQGWSQPTVISDDALDARSPRITFDQKSTFHAIWYRDLEGGVYTKAYQSDKGWLSTTKLGGNSNGKGWFPLITSHSSGVALATWAQWEGSHYIVKASRFDGTRWGNDEVVPRLGSSGDATYPIPLIANDLTTFIGYYQADGDRMDVWTIRLK